MGAQTLIEWTDFTYNPWRGCSKVHTGCLNCYADKQAKRNPGVLGLWGPEGRRIMAAADYLADPFHWDRQAKAAGERKRVFCASMADVFEEWLRPIHDIKGRQVFLDSRGNIAEHPTGTPATLSDLRKQLFRTIDATPWLDWLLVTKRPENIRRFTPGNFGRRNVWLGTSVSDQATADAFVPELVKCRELSPVLFLSAEPLLGSIDLSPWLGKACSRCLGEDGEDDCTECRGAGMVSPPLIDWVIVGGESGPKSRGCDLVAVRSIVDQCRAVGVPVFVKQLGANCYDSDRGNHFEGRRVFTKEDLEDPELAAEAAWALDRIASMMVVPLDHPKGGDPSEWPEFFPRQFPEVSSVEGLLL